MFITIFITGIVCVVIALYFQSKNRTQKHLATTQQALIFEEIQRHKNQILLRQTHLNTYRFLEYNLDEALVVQPEINI